MWNSFGSLRERVREHAKSAAQVAQGVLQAAAAEEDYPSEPQPDSQQDEDAVDWGRWGAPDQGPNKSPVDNSIPVQAQHEPVSSPPEDSLPPPSPDDALPPPPPPEDSFVSAKPPVMNAAPRSHRSSRYVVTGVATSQSQAAAPVVPKPSFFAPRPSVIISKSGDVAADEETDKGDEAANVQALASTCSDVVEEPTADVGGNIYDESNRLGAGGVSATPENATVPAANDTEPPKAEETMHGEERSGLQLGEVPFGDWGTSAEEQSDQGITAQPAEDNFLGWGIESAAAEQQQPENVPPPLADASIASWNIQETAVKQQQDQEANATPIADSLNGWDVSATAVEQPAEQQLQDTVSSPADDVIAGWDVPETSMEPQGTQGTAGKPAEDGFAPWEVPEPSKELQKGQKTEAVPSENSFAGWNVPKVAVEVQRSQSTRASPDSDNLPDWSAPNTVVEEQRSQSDAAIATENNFAQWDVPDAPTGGQQSEPNGWEIPSSVKPKETAHGDDARKEDAFADWGEADRGWNLDGETSAGQGVGDGVDWFSSGVGNSDVRDTSVGAAKEAVITDEDPAKEIQDAYVLDSQNDPERFGSSQLSTSYASKGVIARNEEEEEYHVPPPPTAQSSSENATGTDNLEEDGNENIELEISPRIPDRALHEENNVRSFSLVEPAAESRMDAASSAVESRQCSWQTAAPARNSQEIVSHNPTKSSDPVRPAESSFSDQGAEEAEKKSSHDMVPQCEDQRELAVYEPLSIPQAGQDMLMPQPSEVTFQISELQKQMRTLMLERDSAIAAKEASERETDNLKRSIASVEGDLAHSREESEYFVAQRDAIQKERDLALEQKLEVEKERDEAIQRGGEGLREARNVIEVMRNSQNSTEKREAAISGQIDALRTDLDRISQERNALLGEAEDLRVTLRDVESQSRQKENELRKSLQIAEHESEIARLEREKALETNELHIDENRRLVEAEKGRAAALAASESRVMELENYIASIRTDREDENVQIELFSRQIEEMKDRTQGVIDERNKLYDEKRNLENQIEEYKRHEESSVRDLQDAKREAASFACERDEAKQRFMSMKDQHKELAMRVDALAGERDQLVQARTAAAASSPSVSEKEKALAIECEQKTRAVGILQKKLTSATAKFEKITAQRSTFQRQRDEAGARLRAAGTEFATLNSKLEELSMAKNALQNQLIEIRDERDTALSKVEEMIALESQLKFIQDTLDSKTKEVEDVQSKLSESKQEAASLQEAKATEEQKASNLVTELSELQGRLEVVTRERDLASKQKDDLNEEKSLLQTKLSEREHCEIQLSKQVKSIEADYTTLKEKSAMDLGIAKAELASEQELHKDSKMKLSDLRSECSQYATGVKQIRSTMSSCVEALRSDILQGSETMSFVDWHAVDDILTSEKDFTLVSAANLVSGYSEVTAQIIRDNLTVTREYETLKTKYDDSAKLLVALEQDKSELLVSASEVQTLRVASEEAKQHLEVVCAEKKGMETEIESLREEITVAAAQRAEVEARLSALTHKMEEEMQRQIQLSAEEREGVIQETEKVKTNLNSIWSMLQKSLREEQLEALTDEVSQYSETDEYENVPVLALRATASIITEVSRNRSHIEDIRSKLATVEAEATRLIDRAEIAEQERDTAKGTNERLERKLKVSHGEGKEEAKAHYEGVVAQLEDELDDSRQELSRVSDKANRSEKESSELRALCSKLTSQFNGRTNELDEAEEKIVYLQDQVTTLEEDLEEAHARLKKLEEESTEARQSHVKRLTDKLEETTAQLEEIEKECTRLREAYDAAENTAKESQLLADTHKQAEENLQIAIEQLEAAQESAVEQRTIELQKKLEDAERRCTAATEREAVATMTQKQLAIRDEEIKELRGAIGRLADERVELKLELEKSLSRLNHPDAGGHLVDRRVVRQLLVSYFRVGSVRRRDVLELMSRMLAFTDSDNIAVGLKRRALMDRLGSLVQAPDLDDASLPPLGTVSDKWIEFLMKETEEGEEQAKGW